MPITAGAVVATINGDYFKAYDVTASDVANDETEDLTHGGVVDFAGAAVAPNFYAIVPTAPGTVATTWSIVPTGGSEKTKVTVSRVKGANTGATARIYVGYLHTIFKGQAT